ncbi:MAG: hypothetical protein ACRD3W_22175, partial [Terriglobales bacterium]
IQEDISGLEQSYLVARVEQINGSWGQPAIYLPGKKVTWINKTDDHCILSMYTYQGHFLVVLGNVAISRDLSSLLSAADSSIAKKEQTATAESANADVSASNVAQLSHKTAIYSRKLAGCRIQCEYPQFVGANGIDAQQLWALNNAVRMMVENEATKLVSYVQAPPGRNSKEQASIRTEYDVKFETNKLVSLAVEFDCSSAGESHAGFFSKTLTCVPAPFKRLSFADLVAGNSARIRAVAVEQAKQESSAIALPTVIDNFTVDQSGIQLRPKSGAWGSGIYDEIDVSASALKPMLPGNAVIRSIWK